ncbi:MAG TPA: ferritin-like domain-containing protein [Candidatus Acidoferrum sp.]|nr:ferritin-like domain-containing protein [Candidatus Acidoferrum sp.]
MPWKRTLGLQLDTDARGLRYAGYKGIGEKLADFGEDAAGYARMLQARLRDYGGDPQYDAGTITANKPIQPVFDNALKLVQEIVDAFDGTDGYCAQAWDAGDDETRNLYEHLIKWQNHTVRWLKRQLALIADLGEVNYKAAKL